MIKFYTFHLFKKTVQHSSFLWIVVNDEHDISIIWAPKNSFHWYFPFEFFRSNDQSCKNSTSNPPPPKLPKKQEIPIKDKLTWPTKKTLFKTNKNPPLESETNILFLKDRGTWLSTTMRPGTVKDLKCRKTRKETHGFPLPKGSFFPQPNLCLFA